MSVTVHSHREVVMSEAAAYIKIIDTPSGEENLLARHEFQDLVLPTITPNGQQVGYYVVYLLDALPIINTERPLLAEWLKEKYPEEQDRSTIRLIFEASVCQEMVTLA